MNSRIAVAIAALSVLSLASSAAAQNHVVYHDALSAGWDNWSWNTSVNFAVGNPALGGSGSSIGVTYSSAWAGLYLNTNNPLLATQYTRLRFSIHGGVGGQSISFAARDASAAYGTSHAITAPAGTWQTIELTFAQLGVSNVAGLIWQDATGGPQPAFYLDEIVFVAGSTPPSPGPALAIDVTQDRHAISRDIYGMNWASTELLAELNVPVHRWGGNATTRYNYLVDVSNRASDWYFENIPNDNANPQLLPTGSSSDRFIEDNIAAGSQTLLTVPLIGWTPKARQFDCGFRVSVYGAQQSTDPWQPDCGNGVRSNGSNISGNNPTDTSLAIGPSFVQGWMLHLIGRFGTAAQGGVRFYNLDNEPMLCNHTHRDVHPAPVGYDELRQRTIEYAVAIKTIDPDAQTLGPVFWGWTAYFYSALDAAAGGAWWNTRPDRMAHGDIPLTEWYLQQMRAYEQANGVRLLDYLDLHYYPQSDGVALSDAGNSERQQRRLRTTRSLWDPAYVDESWIGEPVRLIPRMREWVAQHYPGTKLAMTEYNWGGYGHINGALAHADVLGIFGRERLDLATIWTAPEPNDPVAFAFRMFLNYDGSGSTFGETAVRANSADQGAVSAYAAERGDGALTIVLINKATAAQTSVLSIAGFGATVATADVWRYSSANLAAIVHEADLPLSAAGVGQPLAPAGGTITLPASSITLLELRAGAGRGDLNCDGVVDFADIDAFVLALSGAQPYALAYPGCRHGNADVNCDGGVTFADIDAFVACLGGPCGCTP